MESSCDSTVELEEKDEMWLRLIKEWKRSGMSMAEWVRTQKDEDITYSKFQKARDRLFSEDVKRTPFSEREVTWSTISMELPSSKLDVHISSCRIEVEPGFDKKLLQEIVEVLKNVR